MFYGSVLCFTRPALCVAVHSADPLSHRTAEFSKKRPTEVGHVHMIYSTIDLVLPCSTVRSMFHLSGVVPSPSPSTPLHIILRSRRFQQEATHLGLVIIPSHHSRFQQEATHRGGPSRDSAPAPSSDTMAERLAGDPLQVACQV